MSSTVWPRANVFFAQVREDVVVLDVDRDSYACIPDGAGWIDVREDGSLDVHDAQAEPLMKAGLAVDHPTSSLKPFQRPTRRLVAPVPAGVPAGLQAAFWLCRGTLLFRTKSLAALVATAKRWPESPADALSSHIELSLAAHDAAAPWLPGEGQCLQRAFQLKYFLARRGIAADWVFGVRTWPFGAHCWLQAGDTVIGDTLERVTNYTPIMVV